MLVWSSCCEVNKMALLSSSLGNLSSSQLLIRTLSTLPRGPESFKRFRHPICIIHHPSEGKVRSDSNKVHECAKPICNHIPTRTLPASCLGIDQFQFQEKEESTGRKFGISDQKGMHTQPDTILRQEITDELTLVPRTIFCCFDMQQCYMISGSAGKSSRN